MWAMRWPLVLLAAIVLVAGVSIRLRADRASAATSATFTVSAGGVHALNDSFSVSVTLSDVTFDPAHPTWGGYDFDLSYDNTILQATADAPGPGNPCNAVFGFWASVELTPHVVSGCAFQSTTASNFILETITFRCVADGTSALHLPPHWTTSPISRGVGNALFDTNGVDFPMMLNDNSVTCDGSLPTATATSTPMATDTPTATNTPTVTSTPTVTNTPTVTSTPTNTPTATATSVPPRATFSVAPGGTHALNESFTVTVSLSDVAYSAVVPNWSGYDFELDYDGSILAATGVVPGLCPSQEWVARTLSPAVATGCLFQQSTVTTGLLETITFVCKGAGTTSLHLPAAYGGLVLGNDLFGPANSEPIGFALTLNDAAATCDAALPTATSTATPTATDTPSTPLTATATPAGPPDSATMEMRVPAASEPLNTPFVVTANLSTFVPGWSQAWAGYDFELSYDPTILQVASLSPGFCPLTHWGNPYLTPHAVSGCWGLSSNATGILENVVVSCLKDGTTALHIVPRGDPGSVATGSAVFDRLAVDFSMTFKDAMLTCDHAAAAHPDDDGDGCDGVREPALGLDAFNPWDFYSVPAPALIGAPDPLLVFKDNMVAAGDAQAVFVYFKAGARLGAAIYEQDLNGNGVKDGIEYDRSVVGPAQSGPPDGVVSVRDAELAFAQFKRSYVC